MDLDILSLKKEPFSIRVNNEQHIFKVLVGARSRCVDVYPHQKSGCQKAATKQLMMDSALAHIGLEPMTLALLAPRSNQLS
jgi:hypothetical protein